ncbi:hypothetical protein PHYBOEH_011811 [Phytophthora boehmeriae]|uniref:Uncharacterized protein n=1 Tax=Phytophthora boehmeriae TaxID=109152 RepID=A0A8T1VHW1_9STRA|nr:hypothetical protein PHYBOEH_011811 [Phytophthora boehmeriae]
MSCSKRAHPSVDASLSPDAKRLRLHDDQEDSEQEDEAEDDGADKDKDEEPGALGEARLPADIQALPHVMKHLEMLLMTPDEALQEAVSAGQLDWMDRILDASEGLNIPHAAASAAANGQLLALKLLLRYCYKDNLEEDGDGVLSVRHQVLDDQGRVVSKGLAAKTTAAENAAANGHLNIVEYLLPFLTSKDVDGTNNDEVLVDVIAVAARKNHVHIVKFLFPKLFDRHRQYQWEGWCKALEEAAGSGHFALVVFVAGCKAPRWPVSCSRSSRRDALSLAIIGGHDEIVNYLLGLDPAVFCWDLKQACDEAVKLDKRDLKDTLYSLYPKYITNKSE